MLKHRHCLLIACCLLLSYAVHADGLSAQRLPLLRGCLALAEGNPNALTDLAEAAQIAPEDWRTQLLYGKALQKSDQSVLAKGQFRRAAMLAPCRPEPWQAIVTLGHDTNNAPLEFAGLAGLMRLFPEDPQLASRMAQLYRAMGQQAEADHLTAAWKATFPPLKFDKEYLVGGQLATLTELRQLSDRQPDNTEIMTALAAAEWRAGFGERTYQALQRLHQLSPADGDVTRNFAHLCLLLGKTDEALQVMRTSTEQDDTLLQSQAIWSLTCGEYANAIAGLHRLLENAPTDPRLNRLLGTALLLQGDATSAIPPLRLSWDVQLDDRTAQQYLTALEAAGQIDDAVTLGEQARKLFPQETIFTVILANLYRDRKQDVKAADLTAQAAGLRPEAVELSIIAAERYLRAGRTARARDIAERLREQYTGDLVAIFGATCLYQRLLLPEQANLTLGRYLGPGITPPAPTNELLLALAMFAMRDQRFLEAETVLKDIIRLYPTFQPAYTTLGVLYQQQRRWNDAVQLYQRAGERWPSAAQWAVLQGRAATQAGNIPLAITAYQRAVPLAGTATPWLELGDLYRALGDETQARNCWEAAGAHPEAHTFATLRMAQSLTRYGAITQANDLRTALSTQLNIEQAEQRQRWQAILTASGISASAEELSELQQLNSDITLTTLAAP